MIYSVVLFSCIQQSELDIFIYVDICIYVKIKRSSHSPVVFKHGCSLKTYLDHLETKIEIPRYLYFSKNNADMHLILKSDYKFFY